MKEAMLFEKLPDGRGRCGLCSHHCTIADGERGLCQVRENQGGTLYTLVYGRTITQHVDPVEKKPLFHFYPGSTAYSVATPGCNFRCGWCQNWNISQAVPEEHVNMGERLSPAQVVIAARRAGCQSIAYTYTEPTVFFEYAHDTARLAHETGLANILVTNGYLTSDALDTFQPYLDAANVDLKAFRDETYRQYVGARLQPVLDTLKAITRLGIWLEVTTLVIPGINDDARELRDAAEFIANELGIDTPWHISRFFPAHKMTRIPSTPAATLTKAREIGLRAGLRYVYVGNVPGEENTFCRQCGRLLIRRDGYRVVEKHIQPGGRCPDCGAQVAGLWTETEDIPQENGRLRIVVPTQIGNVSPHFGYRLEWAMVDVDQQTKQIIQKSVFLAPADTSSALPQRLHELGTDVILAVGMGRHAQQSIGQQGIKVVLGVPPESPEQLVSDYLDGKVTTRNHG